MIKRTNVPSENSAKIISVKCVDNSIIDISIFDNRHICRRRHHCTKPPTRILNIDLFHLREEKKFLMEQTS